MPYRHTIRGSTWHFDDLKMLLAKASPARSGDLLAGVAASSEQERIIATIASLTVGKFRDWLLGEDATTETLTRIAPGITPEMAAAVSKLMRNQDLILAARKCSVVTRFRNTIGLPGRLSVRLQPNHPTDDVRGIAASMLDGLLYGCGDAVIGINPASDSLSAAITLLKMLDDFRLKYDVPTQSCVLTHVTSTIQAIEKGAPVDLVFQSIAGTEKANTSFGINLGILQEAHEAGQIG